VDHIEAHIDLLNDKQLVQLNHIKSFLKQGVAKLANYFHWKLIDLQQFITFMLKKAELKASEPKRDNQSPTNSESNLKETADIIDIIASWNNMARGQESIPHVVKIDSKLYNAICKQVKSYGKETILSSINKVTGLYSVSNGNRKMTFSYFMTKKTLDLIPTLNIVEDIQSDWFANHQAEKNGIEIIDRMDLDSIPTFDSATAAIKWWNQLQNA